MERILRIPLRLPPYVVSLWLVAFLVISSFLSNKGPNVVALALGVLPFLFVYIGYSAGLCSIRSRIDKNMEAAARVAWFPLSFISIASISTLYLFSDVLDIWLVVGSWTELIVANFLVSFSFFSPLILMWIATRAVDLSTGQSKSSLLRRLLWLIALAYLPIGVFFLGAKALALLDYSER